MGIVISGNKSSFGWVQVFVFLWEGKYINYSWKIQGIIELVITNSVLDLQIGTRWALPSDVYPKPILSLSWFCPTMERPKQVQHSQSYDHTTICLYKAWACYLLSCCISYKILLKEWQTIENLVHIVLFFNLSPRVKWSILTFDNYNIKLAFEIWNLLWKH